METCAPYARQDLARDIHAGWQAVAAVTVDGRAQARNWDNWIEFCSDARRDPYLLKCSKPDQQHCLLRFAALTLPIIPL